MDIDNCFSYLINPETGDLICSECNDEYGLMNNECVYSYFNPCMRINEVGDCLQCQFGYHLALLANNVKECLPISSHQNCVDYDQSAFNLLNIKCIQCASNEFILEPLATPIEVCNQVISIRNCLAYDLKNNF